MDEPRVLGGCSGIRRQYLSYIPTGEGWLYLAAVEDLATREIVGWSMADHLRSGLCVDALVMALQRRGPPRGLLHHSIAACSTPPVPTGRCWGGTASGNR
jgi:transposase InsO family protein